MNKKEVYDKKIEIMKQFLASDGNIDVLIKIQNDERYSNLKNNEKGVEVSKNKKI